MGDAPLGFRKHDTLTPVSYLNWVDSNTFRSRRGTTLPGVVGICHTSGSDASRDTSGFTALFTPWSANDSHTLRSPHRKDSAGLSRNSVESARPSTGRSQRRQ